MQMQSNVKAITAVDDYIRLFPKDIQSILEKVRTTIQDAAPQATQTISHQMPTFKLDGKNLVHFAAWKTHIGFYPTPAGITAFEKELAKYKQAKGSVQFPLDRPIPYALIKKIVQFRVKQRDK